MPRDSRDAGGPLRTRRAGRRTNVALMVVLLMAVITGLSAEPLGTPTVARWVVAAHGVAGLGVALLTPWKSRVAQRGLAKRNPRRSLSLALAVLVLVTLMTGVLHAAGLPERIGRFTVLWVHVASAIALIPLAVWHVVARKTYPRAADMSRRNLLRLGGLASAATVAWWAGERVIAAGGLRGADRRFTGSHEVSSLEPNGVPITQWLDDRVPSISADWSLEVDDDAGERRLTYDEINALQLEEFHAVLDCTSGWWSRQSWEGVRLDRIIATGNARSLEVRSTTGYGRRFPVSDLGRLWLVTRMGGAPLGAGHGFPARVVAPGRRGFWWVKWVTRLETSSVPWWLQSPFPLT